MPTTGSARPFRGWDARRSTAAALVVGLWALAAPAAISAQAPVQVQAPPSPDQALIRFDIPARPLSAAIEAYALATGVQVLYDRPPSDAQRSPGVTGLRTREAALDALLAGTGLHAVFTHRNTVVLRPDEERPAARDFGPPPTDEAVLPLDTLEVRGEATIPPAAGQSLDLRLYGGVVGSAVHQALLADRLTASGRYRVTLKLWIAPSGAVERVVAGSSGDRERDLAIATVVRQVVIDPPPPAGLPQPVVLVVRSRPGA